MSAKNQELIERAKSLIPQIKARAQETEKLRRPHDDTLKDLIDAGILQMCVPKRWGGVEADPLTMHKVVELISSACMSTGWIASFYIGHNVVAAKFPLRAQEEMFGERGFVLMPTANAANLTARNVAGGWVINGRAAWGSGIMHADWVMMSGMADGKPLAFVMPISDVRVDDVWNYCGMAGTGSNDYLAEEVFVPEHRVISGIEMSMGPTAGSTLHDNPLYSIPFILFAYCEIVGVLSGGLAGMTEEFHGIVDKRVRNFSGAVVKDQPQSHIALGEAKVAALIASELSQHHIERTKNILEKRPFSLADRLELKAHAGFISQHCREAANQIMSKAGATNFHLDAPIQRYFRDINTLANHAFWDWDVCRELVGRLSLGLEPNNPLV